MTEYEWQFYWPKWFRFHLDTQPGNSDLTAWRYLVVGPFQFRWR